MGSCIFIFFLYTTKVKAKSVLELGSGPALVGIAAALLGAKEVIISDLEYTLPLMRNNVNLNKDTIECERIECMQLDWFDPPFIDTLSTSINFPEVMIIADCVWVEQLVNPLMDTVDKLCHDNTEVIVTYQRRGKGAHDLFMERLHGIFSKIENVDTMECCGLDKPESISLFLCRR